VFVKVMEKKPNAKSLNLMNEIPLTMRGKSHHYYRDYYHEEMFDLGGK
jgi:hypothetical protein